MKNLFLLLTVLLCAAAVGLFAQEKSIPSGGISIAGDNPLAALKLSDTASAAEYSMETVSGQFPNVVRVETKKKPDNNFAVQVKAPITKAVKQNDTILAVFGIRGVQSSKESGEVQCEFVFEQTEGKFEKTVISPLSAVVGEWKMFYIPFMAKEDYAAGKAQICFRLGYDPQTIEIGGLKLLDYGKSVKITDLPKSTSVSIQYNPGVGQNEPWRKAALERIDAIRKGDLSVIVSDAAGAPVSDAAVSVRMIRHAFKFGSAVTARWLTEQSPTGNKYRELVKEMFNRVALENDLKWAGWDDMNNRQRTIDAAAWLHSNGIEIRGHNLVWPSWKFLPKSLQQFKNDPFGLHDKITEHIRDEAGFWKGQLIDWDVMNEPFANHDVMDICGKNIMVEWYKLTHELDPTANLYVNDYGILSARGMDKKHQDSYYGTIQYLIDSGAPIDGIGMQSHFGSDFTPPERMVEILDRFAGLGKMIQSTEFDITTKNEAAQASYTRDVMTVLFSHRAVVGIVMWGFWEGAHWSPDAALYHKDFSIKPNGEAWRDLVLNQWRTKADGRTDSRGAYSVRGFAGDYEITVTSGAKIKTISAKLPKEGTALTVTME